MSSVMTQIENRVHECFDIANRKLGISIPYPLILFRLRGTCAGRACSFHLKLNFNLAMAMENLEDYLRQIVPHECAHIFADRYYNTRCCHGSKWKHIMRYVYGLEPERCHNYDVSNHYIRKYKRIRYIYHCSCSIIKTQPRFHKAILNGERVWCKSCKQVLTSADYNGMVEL